MSGDAAAEAILHLLSRRAPGRSICPSEAARALDPDRWRDRMDEIRAAAARLARQGQLRVTQAGAAVDPATARGPIRLSRPAPDP